MMWNTLVSRLYHVCIQFLQLFEVYFAAEEGCGRRMVIVSYTAANIVLYVQCRELE